MRVSGGIGTAHGAVRHEQLAEQGVQSALEGIDKRRRSRGYDRVPT